MARLIKRYENRKLYDMEQKHYVSLEELAGLIHQGHQVQVVENATGEDLTAQTLTKIIVEEDRQGRPGLPSEVLHELIRWGGKVVSTTADQFEQYLDRLVRASLERLGPVRQVREDLDRLKGRIAGLEGLITELVAQLEEPTGEDHERGKPARDSGTEATGNRQAG